MANQHIELESLAAAEWVGPIPEHGPHIRGQKS